MLRLLRIHENIMDGCSGREEGEKREKMVGNKMKMRRGKREKMLEK